MGAPHALAAGLHRQSALSCAVVNSGVRACQALPGLAQLASPPIHLLPVAWLSGRAITRDPIPKAHFRSGLGVQARAAAPAIIFIDEIDSVGRIR